MNTWNFSSLELDYANQILKSDLLHQLVSDHKKRLLCMKNFLSEAKVPFKLVRLKNRTFIVVRFDERAYSAPYTKTLVAHYDCAPNSLGANDNGAACAQLAFFAKTLLTKAMPHNIQIIFTDAEELNQQSISQQGAFLLGLGLRRLAKNAKPLVFVFDTCGRGDTLVVSQSGIFSRKFDTPSEKQELLTLHKDILALSKRAELSAVSLPTAYSDNAGLLATGAISQLITVLPYNEVALYAKTLKTLKATLPDEAFYQEVQNTIIETAKSPNPTLSRATPKTWKLLHTQADTLENLTPEAFAVITRFLNQLVEYKI